MPPRATGDQAAEVRRLKATGATRIDVGEPKDATVVLAHPEGNEFCVLNPARHLTTSGGCITGLSAASA